MSHLTDHADRLRESFPEGIAEIRNDLGMDVVVVKAERLTGVMEMLRDELGFDFLMDVSGVDWLPRTPRFDVNYHLYSLEMNERVRVKVHPADEDPHLPSVVALYPTADWHEREVFDFFGVVFDGHPNLTRILMPDEWVGHPLRKDYPVGGVPVEYKIEPAYVGDNIVGERARPASGGVPARLRRDRGRASHWTWTGPPASGVRQGEPELGAVDEEGEGDD
jgi:NADH-quinone oxidoreductase subunit C